MIEKIFVPDCIEKVEGKPWQPIEIATVNDSIVRLAYFEGEYHWHKHSNAEEMFYVLLGKIEIHIKDKESIKVDAGGLVVVPKGIEHKPASKKGAYVLMFEPKTLVSTGD